MRRDLDSICSARFRWSVVCSAMTTNDAFNQHNNRTKQRTDEKKRRENMLRRAQEAEVKLSARLDNLLEAEVELVERLGDLLEGIDTPLAIETVINTIDETVFTTLDLTYGGPSSWIVIDHYRHKAWFSTTAPDYNDAQSKETRLELELSEEQFDQLALNFWCPRIKVNHLDKNGLPF